jgi:hypothetical protein
MFEGRTFELSEKDFADMLNKNCKDFLNNPTLLQRNKHDEGPQFSCVSPKSYIRTSLMSGASAGVKSNHGTLLMDNLPSWSNFPKRSQSLIGITDVNTHLTFGSHRYFVIPFDGARFGVCPAGDLWGVKSVLFDTYQFSFDDRLSDMFTDLKISDKSYDEMMNEFQKVYYDWLRNNSTSPRKEKSYINARVETLFNELKRGGFKDIREGLSSVFSPDNFESISYVNNGDTAPKGFKCLDYNGLVDYKSKGFNYSKKEFWTDSDCLLYKVNVDEYLNRLEEVIINEFSHFIKMYKEE